MACRLKPIPKWPRSSPVCGIGDHRRLRELFDKHREKLRRMVPCGSITGSPAVSPHPDVLAGSVHRRSEAGRTLLREAGSAILRLAAAGGRAAAGGCSPRTPRPETRTRKGSVDLPRDPGHGFRVAWRRACSGNLSSPSDAAAKNETFARLEEALEQMDPLDREVLVLRHFEELSNAETAALLGHPAAAASKRYVRALARLKEILETIPGFRPRGTHDPARRSRPGGCAGRGVRRPVAPRRTPLRQRLRRRSPRPRRAAPRTAAGRRPDGVLEAVPPRIGDDGQKAIPDRLRRFPHRARTGPRRHGRGVRGGAGVARPPGRVEGSCHARPARRRRGASDSSARRRPPRNCTTRTSFPSSASANRTACHTTSCN